MSHEMYKEQILELFKHPVNFGELDGATHSAHKHNPSCGDEFTMQLIVSGSGAGGVVSDVKFTGSGCAISTAACCLVTDKIKGMKVSDVLKMSSEEMLELLGIPVSAGRMKCALLGLEVAQDSLKKR